MSTVNSARPAVSGHHHRGVAPPQDRLRRHDEPGDVREVLRRHGDKAVEILSDHRGHALVDDVLVHRFSAARAGAGRRRPMRNRSGLNGARFVHRLVAGDQLGHQPSGARGEVQSLHRVPGANTTFVRRSERPMTGRPSGVQGRMPRHTSGHTTRLDPAQRPNAGVQRRVQRGPRSTRMSSPVSCSVPARRRRSSNGVAMTLASVRYTGMAGSGRRALEIDVVSLAALDRQLDPGPLRQLRRPRAVGHHDLARAHLADGRVEHGHPASLGPKVEHLGARVMRAPAASTACGGGRA